MDQSLSAQEASEHLINIEEDFKRIWNDSSVPALERRRLIAYFILEASTTIIHNWGRAGFLPRKFYGNNKRCLYEPIPNNYVLVK